MTKIPIFKIFGQDNPQVEKSILPFLELRRWSDLNTEDKIIAYQELLNTGWIKKYSSEIYNTIKYLNHCFLRICPGKNLHQIKPERTSRGLGNMGNYYNAAFIDFTHIFLNEGNDAIVYLMLTKFAQEHIQTIYFNKLNEETNDKIIEDNINKAFKNFDYLANCLNHIFEQFAINVMLTRNGLIPRQDEKINKDIYIPALEILANPKWKFVSDDLSETFTEFNKKNYPEVITKAHRVIQRFLQVLTNEGKNGRGEIGKLFGKAKKEKLIPINRFTEPIITVFQGFIVSERANRSTAKPASVKATQSDALLVMNVVMVFIQHCLQKEK